MSRWKPVQHDESDVARLERELEEARKQIEASDWAQRQLTTSLEEARQELERSQELRGVLRAQLHAAEAAAEEARQERDRIEAYGEQQEDRIARDSARIGELEAALRTIANSHDGIRDPAQHCTDLSRLAQRALQLTTERR
mgnify:CR=1 FL=1